MFGDEKLTLAQRIKSLPLQPAKSVLCQLKLQEEFCIFCKNPILD